MDHVSDTPSLVFEAHALTKTYKRNGRLFNALENVELAVARGKSIAIVGESGAGKSTLARILIAREAPTSGSLLFCGSDVSHIRSSRDRRAYWSRVQLVSQDPSVAFDPRFKVRQVLAEPLRNFDVCPRDEVEHRSLGLLEMVGLDSSYMDRLPSQMSGGQQQRVSIARALACDPVCILLDEATSALDMTIQEQLVELLSQLREQRKLTYVFIHHDLGTAQRVSERIVVMSHGRVEQTIRSQDLGSSTNEYVKGLVGAVFSLGTPRSSML